MAQGIVLGRSFPPEKRVALVIGNADYRGAPLKNPANDARAVAAKLRDLGFEVVQYENLGRGQFGAAVADFVARIKPGGAALFYYAGHGIQMNERNYLISTDAEIPHEAAVPFVGIDASQVGEQMVRAGARVMIMVLDACRNNPFERRLRGGGFGRGLAKMDAARGSIIAFATAPGSVAADGEGEHGVYTEALLRALSVPGLKAEEVFKRAREQVIARTRDEQTPWEQSSLVGEFVFNTPAPPPAPVADAAQPPPADREALFWQTIQSSINAPDFEAYLQRYPDGEFAALARNRLATLAKAAAPQGPLPAASAIMPQSAPPSAATGPAGADTAKAERPLLPVDREFVAKVASRVREAPDIKSRQVASLREGEVARVLARVKGAEWYQIDVKDQPPGFVAASLLEEFEAYRRRKGDGKDADGSRMLDAKIAMLGASPIGDGVANLRDCDACPELVVVPPGTFKMGASLSDWIERKEPAEAPQREVRIARPFALGRYEVTWAQFQVCIDERACCLGGKRCARLSDDDRGLAIESDKRPAAGVSWEDAQDYVLWLSRSTGKRYRLPSEAEWEYAARAGTATTRYWGDDLEQSCKHANLLDRAYRRKWWIGKWWMVGAAVECDDGHAGPAPVGRFSPNPFGLYDMLGNVQEWVEDRWHADYSGAPEDGSAWDRGGDETKRVRRGGSWERTVTDLRAAFRSAESADDRDRDTGFRVLRELP